jgi:N-acetylglucosamine-6-phosphate deacetylase
VTVRDRGVLVEDGRILDILYRAPKDCQVIDLDGCYLLPGLIDLHCHGGDGEEFIDGDEESIRLACELHAAHGTRVIYPTISASDYETTYRALEGIEACRDRMPLLIPGVHLEGPYLAPEMCGAQDTGVIRAPKKEEYEALWNRFGSLIARWSYAPERDTDGAFLAFLTERELLPLPLIRRRSILICWRRWREAIAL